MGQIFGILGFFLSMLAIFFASEIMRRSSDRQIKLESALFKAQIQIQEIEKKMGKVNRLAEDLRHQKKRQAETITALANKSEAVKEETAKEETARFVPSEHKQAKTG